MDNIFGVDLDQNLLSGLSQSQSESESQSQSQNDRLSTSGSEYLPDSESELDSEEFYFNSQVYRNF